MDESAEVKNVSEATVPELSSVLTGFRVVDRVGDDLGTVAEVNAARTCALVESGKPLLRRAKTHGLHVSAVDHVDLDAFTISLRVSAGDVAGAPECRELDADCEAALTRYYGELR